MTNYSPIYKWELGFRLSSLLDGRKAFAPLTIQDGKKIPACIGYGKTPEEAERSAADIVGNTSLLFVATDAEVPIRDAVLSCLKTEYGKSVRSISKKIQRPFSSVEEVLEGLVNEGEVLVLRRGSKSFFRKKSQRVKCEEFYRRVNLCPPMPIHTPKSSFINSIKPERFFDD